MMNLRHFAVFAVAVALVGCKGGEVKTTDTTTTSGGTTGVAPAPDKPVLPDSLKNAAYEYRGLGNEKLKTYVTELPLQAEEEGTEAAHLDRVEDGVAFFKIERTGSLSRIGTETMKLSPDGVRTIASSAGEVSPYLELASDLSPGKTWTTDADMKTSAESLDATATMKVVGMEKITVPAGTFDCLVVKATINGTVSGSGDKSVNGKSTTDVTVYYAKDIGIVKLIGKSTRARGQSQALSIILKSIGA